MDNLVIIRQVNEIVETFFLGVKVNNLPTDNLSVVCAVGRETVMIALDRHNLEAEVDRAMRVIARRLGLDRYGRETFLNECQKGKDRWPR